MHILIIRPGAIGDTLLTFPVIEALRGQVDDPHVTFVGNAAVLPLTRTFGLAEDTDDYEASRWGELFSAAGIRTPSLRELLQQTDLAICWLRDPDGLVRRNLAAAGVRRIIQAPGRPPGGERVHEMTYLARSIGLEGVRSPLFDKLLDVRGEQEAEDGGVQLRRIAIHPGSGGASKCWPVERFAAVVSGLWRRRRPVLLLAGPADHERLMELQRLLPPPEEAAMLMTLRNAPLLDVARHLQHCDAYLGNDSGVTHLAALLGVPTVALFGPSDPVVWQPQGRAVRVLYEPRLEDIGVEMVLRALDGLM
jgi:heptosyltransferase-3